MKSRSLQITPTKKILYGILEMSAREYVISNIIY